VRYTAVVVDGAAQAFRITRIAVNGITKNVFFTVFSSLNGLRLRYWRWGVCLDKLDNQTLFACTCGAAQVGAGKTRNQPAEGVACPGKNACRRWRRTYLST